MSVIETVIEIPTEHEKNICGQFDSYLKKIERTLHVTIVARDGVIKLIGPEDMIKKAHRGLCQLVWRQRQRCDLRARGTESGSRERRAREGIVSQQPFSDACDGACGAAHHVR